tara:strand:+ start:493 stop:753 length:261 start_codon:yes stop_codon:yes gene_type:complete
MAGTCTITKKVGPSSFSKYRTAGTEVERNISIGDCIRLTVESVGEITTLRTRSIFRDQKSTRARVEKADYKFTYNSGRTVKGSIQK